MQTINIYEAVLQLPALIEQAIAGDEIIIARDGQPLVKLTPCQVELPPIKPGLWKGKGRIAEDFDELPKEFIDAFYKEQE